MQPVTVRDSTDDIREIFLESLRKVRTEPWLARNAKDVVQVLGPLLQGSQTIVQAELPQAVDSLVSAALEGRKRVRIKELGNKEAVGAVSQSDVGITWAQYGIASLGTLVEIVQDDAQKLVSCLPRVHIAFLQSSRILPDFASAMREVGHAIRESPPEKRPVVSLITGPSRTSDIESRLLYGVHGPLTLSAIILDWNADGELND